MKSWKLLIVSVLVAGPVFAVGSTESPATTSTELKKEEVKKEKVKSPWSTRAFATYYGGFREDIDPYKVYGASMGFKFDSGAQMSILQSITHFSYIYQGQSELQVSDTSVGVSQKLLDDFYGLKVRAKAKLTVPLSEFSTRAGVLTKPGLSVHFSRKFFDNKLSTGLGFSGTYYVNRYKTTSTFSGAGGGRPLRHWTGGVSALAGYKLSEKLSVSGSAGYSYLEYEEVGFKNQSSNLGLNNPPVHRYSFGLSGSFAWNQHLSLSAGYGQASQVEKRGGLELVVFDEMVTQWSMGASYSF